MNRSQFFRTLAGGAAVAIVAPRLLAREPVKAVATDVADIPKGIPIKTISDAYRETGEVPFNIPYAQFDPGVIAELQKMWGMGIGLHEILEMRG